MKAEKDFSLRGLLCQRCNKTCHPLPRNICNEISWYSSFHIPSSALSRNLCQETWQNWQAHSEHWRLLESNVLAADFQIKLMLFLFQCVLQKSELPSQESRCTFSATTSRLKPMKSCDWFDVNPLQRSVWKGFVEEHTLNLCVELHSNPERCYMDVVGFDCYSTKLS